MEDDMELFETLYGEDKGLVEFVESLSPEKREEFLKELLEEYFE